jgi:hypothetical protein
MVSPKQRDIRKDFMDTGFRGAKIGGIERDTLMDRTVGWGKPARTERIKNTCGWELKGR